MPAHPHTYSTLEICWLTTNIVFALLSLRFVLPQCSTSFWGRLLWVGFVFGVNAVFDWKDDNIDWLSGHRFFYEPFCLWVVNVTILSWLRRSSWTQRSDQFEQTHQRLLWVIIIVMFLLIPLVMYWQWRW